MCPQTEGLSNETPFLTIPFEICTDTDFSIFLEKKKDKNLLFANSYNISSLHNFLFQVDENTQIHQNGPSQNHVENIAKPRHSNIQVNEHFFFISQLFKFDF